MFKDIFMNAQFITVENHQIHYYKIGSGSKIMLAFHGFGLDGTSFMPLGVKLQNKYTIYSFDLFYHGKSYWSNNTIPLTQIFWKRFIESFTQEQGIDRFSLICYSLGGKFALSTLVSFADRIEKVVFIAPDGIQTNMWYSLATYPIIFRNYFRSMIVKPQLFYRLLSFFKKLGLVDKGISKFAASQMNTIKKRRGVYYSWIIFKNLRFDMRQVASRINQNDIETIMILGSFDKIITKKGMSQLLNKLEHHHLEIIKSGHNDIIKNVAADLNLVALF